ncbi:transcription elongation factor GreA [Candidatus Nomurabacteria bacterium]|nr:transcription elongation factor GreA [Candidatus Nomurabacteria bacterium]
MKEEKQYLTKEKFDELNLELTNLKTIKRKEVAENLEQAKSLGDLSENAEYHAAREMQANIEERIAKLESVIKSAVIVSPHHSDSVDVGSTVTVQKVGEKDTKVYNIVGLEEIDTTKGRISHASPLGKSLMGKKKGETFSFNTPSGKKDYKVVDIA